MDESSDIAADKSVVNWLMQVISGQKAVELNLNGNGNGNGHVEAHPEGEPQQSAVTAEGTPQKAEPGNNGITVEDIWPELKPQQKNEPEKGAITVEDISRSPEFQPVEPFELSTKEISVEDISRDPVLQEGATSESELPVEEIFLAPGAQHEPIADHEEIADVVTSADISYAPGAEPIEAHEDVIPDLLRDVQAEPESGEVDLPVGAVTVEDISREPDAVEPEDTVEPAKTAVTAEDISREPVTQMESHPAEAVESVFAHGDIWKDPARLEVEPPAGDIHAHGPEPTVYHEAEHTETVSRAEDLYREAGRRFPEELREIDNARPENMNAAWKTLLRLGSVLPLVARALPMMENAPGGEPNTGLVHEVRQEVAGMRMVQYEMRTAVQDHALQLKRVEEQLTRMRQSMESDTSENDELVESVKSTVKLVRMMGIGLGALLAILIVMVAILMTHGH